MTLYYITLYCITLYCITLYCVIFYYITFCARTCNFIFYMIWHDIVDMMWCMTYDMIYDVIRHFMMQIVYFTSISSDYDSQYLFVPGSNICPPESIHCLYLVSSCFT